MIGIITLEDIIEELVDDQEDEDLKALQGEQLRHKEKLILLFSDQNKSGSNGNALSDVEVHAVIEFLQKQIKAFSANRMKQKVLCKLVTQNSQILEITSDATLASPG